MNKIIQIGYKRYNVTSDDNYLSAIGDSFEPHMLDLYNVLVDKNSVVADIGANIGLASLWFSEKSERCYAFEPSPTTFKFLKENLEVACAKNVVASNLGLGSKNENLTITFSKSNRSGAFVSNTTKLSGGYISEDIKITTLDSFFKNMDDKPNFLKIDVEGYETEVIKGASDLISSCKPTVVMELNVFCLDVLHRICVPDYIDKMKSVFPVLFAIDSNNKSILNLHNMTEAYEAMHAHVVHRRYPNLVGGFSKSILEKLVDLVSTRAVNLVAS